MLFDPIYWMMIAPALLLAFWAQMKVKRAYSKYSRVPTKQRMSGAQVAQSLLAQNNLSSIPIEIAPGELSDHYDPKKKVLRLSQGVHQGTSIAAAGIAAHEVGHAIQHAKGYAPLNLRTYMYPVASLGSNAAWWIFIIGIIVGSGSFLGGWMIDLGIILFIAFVVFSLVTLPVEFNASSRALRALDGYGFLDQEEMIGARKVLNAAALTYVAAAMMAIMQLLYMLMRRD